MKHYHNNSIRILMVAAFASGLLLGSTGKLFTGVLVPQAHAQASFPAPVATNENTNLASRLPDQAHAMTDVGYHFANLWFAAGQTNWPLANYYLGETRSHLKWAVQIHPVRQVGSSQVDLRGISDAVDNTLLAGIAKNIDAKDLAGFKIAYRNTLEGCYACHTACQKPYLRPQIPDAPGAPIISFAPNASLPK